MSPALGTFETRLLAELRHVVAEAGPPAPAAPGPRRRRVALAVAGGGAIAAGVAIGLPMLAGQQLPAAYAVSTQDDGSVTVSISRWEDAEGLERQLEAHGVSAEVDYAPAGKACRWPRFEPAAATGPWLGPSVRQADDGISFTLRPAEYAGRTLVITHIALDSGQGVPSALTGVALAAGPVAPCQLVDAADSGDPAFHLITREDSAPPSTR